jgi:hypothetical protein
MSSTSSILNPEFQQKACDALNDPQVQKKVAGFLTAVIILAILLVIFAIVSFVLSGCLSSRGS